VVEWVVTDAPLGRVAALVAAADPVAPLDPLREVSVGALVIGVCVCVAAPLAPTSNDGATVVPSEAAEVPGFRLGGVAGDSLVDWADELGVALAEDAEQTDDPVVSAGGTLVSAGEPDPPASAPDCAAPGAEIPPAELDGGEPFGEHGFAPDVAAVPGAVDAVGAGAFPPLVADLEVDSVGPGGGLSDGPPSDVDVALTVVLAPLFFDRGAEGSEIAVESAGTDADRADGDAAAAETADGDVTEADISSFTRAELAADAVEQAAEEPPFGDEHEGLNARAAGAATPTSSAASVSATSHVLYRGRNADRTKVASFCMQCPLTANRQRIVPTVLSSHTLLSPSVPTLNLR
jgi:hypothetical protein